MQIFFYLLSWFPYSSHQSSFHRNLWRKMALSRVRVIVRPGHLRAHSSEQRNILPEDLLILQFYKYPIALAWYKTWSDAEERGTTVHYLGRHKFICLPSGKENPAPECLWLLLILALVWGLPSVEGHRMTQVWLWGLYELPTQLSSFSFLSNTLSNVHIWKWMDWTRWLPMNPLVLPVCNGHKSAWQDCV